MMGVVEGGWGFVWAAYGISAAWLAVYGIALHVRLRAEQKRVEREAGRRTS